MIIWIYIHPLIILFAHFKTDENMHNFIIMEFIVESDKHLFQ